MGCQKRHTTSHSSTVATISSSELERLGGLGGGVGCHLGAPAPRQLSQLEVCCQSDQPTNEPPGRREHQPACTSSDDGAFYSGRQVSTPPARSRAGAERPRPPGLKFKLLVKERRKKGSWNGERKHPFKAPSASPHRPSPLRHSRLRPCLLNVGSAAAENNIPQPADCPTFLSPLSADESHPRSRDPVLHAVLLCVHLELQGSP